MTLDHIIEILWALVVIVVGAIIWFVRLEGRVNLIERVTSDWIQERREVLNQVIAHMDRIESKVDKIALRCAAFSHLHDTLMSREGGDAEP